MRVTVTDGEIVYRRWLRRRQLPLDRVQWVYLQQEDVTAHMCCGMYASEIGRVIVLDQEGKKEIFQFDGMKRAKELLREIQAAKPDLAIGYTKANRARFEGETITAEGK